MEKTKDITPIEYAKYRGWSVQNVRKHFKATGLEKFPEVISVKHFSRFYVFVVDSDLIIPTTKIERVSF